MKFVRHFSMNFLFFFAFVFFTILPAEGNPVQTTTGSRLKDATSENSNDYGNTEDATKASDCIPQEYTLSEVFFFESSALFLKAKKITVNSSEYQERDGKIFTCISFENANKYPLVLNCTEKFDYPSEDYEILPNSSVILYGEEIIPPEEYEFDGDYLLLCSLNDTSEGNFTRSSLYTISIYIGKIGSGISIISLILHLSIFAILPTLRNLPGYNLASLSTAFLLAYSFVLIGQIPEVLGLSCIISGVLQQNFFLVAFFCMNVLAFDVWRTLKLATEKLVVGSQNTRKRQFIWYSLYAWGCPLIISTISIVVDNVDGVPSGIKPRYGEDDICWINNGLAKTIFFVAPAFTLFIINGIFFVRSFFMISGNTMKWKKDENKQSVKLNFILYVRLAIMMGLSWLAGVIALASNNKIIWIIFDLLNSLQGLFLFLLFTCTRKVLKQLIEKTNSMKLLSVKQNTLSTNSSACSTKF